MAVITVFCQHILVIMVFFDEIAYHNNVCFCCGLVIGNIVVIVLWNKTDVLMLKQTNC